MQLPEHVLANRKAWGEWAEALSSEVKGPAAAADGHDYYERWLAALETLIAQKSVAGRGEVDALAAAWQRAAQATPHGKPIELASDPLGGATAHIMQPKERHP